MSRAMKFDCGCVVRIDGSFSDRCAAHAAEDSQHEPANPMTPFDEKRWATRVDEMTDYGTLPVARTQIIALAKQVHDAAVEAEREACAKIAEQTSALNKTQSGFDIVAYKRSVAAQIRSRSTPPVGDEVKDG